MRVSLRDGRVVSIPDTLKGQELIAHLDRLENPVSVPERVVGNLEHGVGNLLRDVGNIAGMFGSSMGRLPQELGKAFQDLPAARRVEEQPATSFLGSVGEGLVRFVPEIPLYAMGEGVAMTGLKAAGKVAPGIAKVATKLAPTKGASLLTETPKAAARATMGGAVVGTSAAEPGTPIGERLAEGAVEGAEFGAATLVFHPLFSAVKAFPRLFRKDKGLKPEDVTPEKVEEVTGKLKDKAESGDAEARKYYEEIKAAQDKAASIEGDIGDVSVEFTFTSKKGNVYKKVGEAWFDSKGKIVKNKAILNAAEKGRVKVGKTEELSGLEGEEDLIIGDRLDAREEGLNASANTERVASGERGREEPVSGQPDTEGGGGEAEAGRVLQAPQGEGTKAEAEGVGKESAVSAKVEKQPWEMTREEFETNPPDGFMFDAKLKHEADAHTNIIRIGPKFFELPQEAREGVIRHELAHGFEDRAVGSADFYDLIQKKQMFGPLDENGKIVRGINGQYKPGENLVEAYVMLFEDPKWLKKNYPIAYEYVIKEAKTQGKPVPPEVLKDYPELAEKVAPKPPASVKKLPKENKLTRAERTLLVRAGHPYERIKGMSPEEAQTALAQATQGPQAPTPEVIAKTKKVEEGIQDYLRKRRGMSDAEKEPLVEKGEADYEGMEEGLRTLSLTEDDAAILSTVRDVVDRGGPEAEAALMRGAETDISLLKEQKAQRLKERQEALFPKPKSKAEEHRGKARRTRKSKVEEPKTTEDYEAILEAEGITKKKINYADVKSELGEVFDALGESGLKKKKNFEISEYTVRAGESVELPPTWHDATFRKTIFKDANGKLIEGASGSYDTWMSSNRVAIGGKGKIPPGGTIYVVDLGPYDIRDIKIYRSLGEKVKAEEHRGRRRRIRKSEAEEPKTAEDYEALLESEGMPAELDLESDNGYILDSLGLQQLYQHVKQARARRKAMRENKEFVALEENIGKDNATILQEKLREKDVIPTTEFYMSSFMWAKEHPELEKIWFNLMKGDMKQPHDYANAATLLRSIESTLSKAERVEMTSVMRKEKTSNNPRVNEAAGKVREYLDFMREVWRQHLRVGFRKHLSKDEYSALLAMIEGEDPKVVAKAFRDAGKKINARVLKSIHKDYMEIDNWGLDDYVPNVELGRLKIVGTTLHTNAKGEEVVRKKLIAVGQNLEDAERKVAAYLERNPDIHEVYIDNSFRMWDASAVGLSRRQYWSVVGRLKKGLQKQIEDLESGVAKRLAERAIKKQFVIKPTDKFSPYTQERKSDFLGERDIFPVLYNYAYTMTKKLNLDPVIDDFRRMSPNLPENLNENMTRLIDDVKGRYWASDKLADAIIDSAGRWLRKKGVEVYPQGGAIVSRGLSKVRQLQTTMKFMYRPVAGAINFISGQGHVWVKVGFKYMAEAARYMRTKEGREFIRGVSDFLGTTIVEEGTGKIKSKTPFWAPTAAFNKPETPNREMGVVANYLFAKGEFGMSDAAARDFAIKANWFQNFTYNMASLPRIMRGPVGKTIFQYKPYFVKELEFVSTLRGPEIARYIGLQLALAGPRGYVYLLRSLPVIGLFAGWREIESWMNREHPVLSRGIGGVMGVDVTAPATFQFPSGRFDIMGPALSDMVKLYDNVIQPMLKGEMVTGVHYGEGSKGDVRGWLESSVPILRHWNNIIDQVVSPSGWVTDERGRRMYHIDNTAGFVTSSIAGAENIKASMIRIASRDEVERERSYKANKTVVIDKVLDAITKGESLSDSLLDQMVEYNITPGSLRRGAASRLLDIRQRRILQTEISRRPELLERWPDFEAKD